MDYSKIINKGSDTVIVIKRDGREVEFDKERIYNAIIKGMKHSGHIREGIAMDRAKSIEEENKDKENLSINEIEIMVFNKLISKKQKDTARAYEGYKQIREFQRNNRNSIMEG